MEQNDVGNNAKNGPRNERSMLFVKPEDKYYFVFMTMFLSGIVSIMPWSFFVTADDYWKYRFRDPSGTIHPPDYKTPLQTTFSSYLIIASKVPLLVFLFLNSALNAKLSPEARIIPSLILTIAIFAAHVVLTYIDFDHRQELFLGIALGAASLVNVASGFLQGAFFGICSCLPRKYTAAVTYGQGASLVIASLLQVVTLSADSEPTNSALIYFSSGVAILVLSFIAFLIILRTDFYKHHLFYQVGRNDHNVTLDVSLCWLSLQIWRYIVSMVFTFWVTLSVTPALQVLVVQTHDIIPERYFIPVCVFLIPNIMDFLGRIMGSIIPFKTGNGWILLAITALRFVFIPLSMFCNLQPRNHLPVVFKDDAVFTVIAILMSACAGYIQTIATTEAPRMVDVKYQETVGTLMAFGIGIGLTLGSLSSIGLIEAL